MNNVFKASVRNYEHIAFKVLTIQNSEFPDYIQKPHTWKSIKIGRGGFETVAEYASFMELLAGDLEEVIIEKIAVPYQRQRRAVPAVNFPKLFKMKCGSDSLQFEIISPNLKVVDLCHEINRERAIALLRTNSQLEELTINYEGIGDLFLDSPITNGLNLSLKKLHVRRFEDNTVQLTVGPNNQQNFELFLNTQRASLEEVIVEWNGQLPADTWVFYLGDTCIRTLQLIFREMTGIHKLLVSDTKDFLNNDFYPEGDLQFAPNPNITELRVRFKKTRQANFAVKQLVRACPNLKILSVHEMDQGLLEVCAQHLKSVEAIYTLSFKVDTLTAGNIKFDKLRKINFYECIVKDDPDIGKLKLSVMKSSVLKLLT